jgi:pimeloyl-ACP methyl ester carboxylesterase
MAAHFAWLHPDDVQGLVLWAAYPAEGDDLSDRSLEVVSIYGTRDGLTTLADIQASRRLLPVETEWVAVEGGNHAQFGWYGPQGGDGQATLGRPAQQAQAVGATLDLLSRLANSGA